MPNPTWLAVRATAIALALAATLTALIRLLCFSHIGHDQAWYLYAAQRMLTGVQLYGPQLTETNPPLILWLSLLPALAAQLLHVPATLALKLLVIALIVCSTTWCARMLTILNRAPNPTSRTQHLLLVACIFFAESHIIFEDFGQREHLLVILIMPYLFAIGTGGAPLLSRRELIAVAATAGLAVSLKPQQILLLAAFQLSVALSLRGRNILRTPEFFALLCLCATCLLYGACILLFAPLYLHTTLPLLRNTYWAFGMYSAAQLIKNQPAFDALFLISAAIFLFGRRRLGFSPMPAHLLAASLGASLAYAIQHAGFNYQKIPHAALLSLAILILLVEFLSPRFPALHAPLRLTRLQWTACAAAALLYAAASAHRIRAHQVTLSHQRPTMQNFLASLPPGTSVFALSTALNATFPDILEDRLVWGSRFAHLWMLPAIQQNEDMERTGRIPAKVLPPATLQQLRQLQRQDTTQDLLRWRPRYVFVPRCVQPPDCQSITTPGFDTLDWFRQSPAFAAAWSSYRYRETLPNGRDPIQFDVYALNPQAQP